MEAAMRAGDAAEGAEFVEGWLVAQVLGEGAYGEVRLLVNSRTGESVALKATRAGSGEGDDGGRAAGREAALHRALRHPHVLRCYGARQHLHTHYMFLEYAVGGELFDRIEPDVGMSEDAAARYWRQLLAGVGYLHEHGVAHRDIKPENLLLDAHDNLKISDFGMATVFRFKGAERLLARRCGTLPYVGPEVLAGPYRAQPADLWSCALVLLAMLAGELPWEQPSSEAAGYRVWVSAAPSAPAAPPWNKLSAGALALVRAVLRAEPARRLDLPRLAAHPWTTSTGTALETKRSSCGGGGALWMSQPAASEPGDGELTAGAMHELMSFSQPHAPQDMVLAWGGSQPAAGGGEAVLQRLVRRLTRVMVRAEPAAALRRLHADLAPLNYTCRLNTPNQMTICTVEARGVPLVFKVLALDMGAGLTLLDFRLSRGCGLEFKRRFMGVRRALADLLAPEPSTHSK